jgi:hypothetical protein
MQSSHSTAERHLQQSLTPEAVDRELAPHNDILQKGHNHEYSDSRARQPQGAFTIFHPLLDGLSFYLATMAWNKYILMSAGVSRHPLHYLPPGTPPLPPSPPPVDDNGDPLLYYLYKDRKEFALTNFLFKRNQMPGTEIDELMQIVSNYLPTDQDPPFANHGDLYDTIDATLLGDAPWQLFSVTYIGELLANGHIPPWMLAEYDIWCWDPKIVL